MILYTTSALYNSCHLNMRTQSVHLCPHTGVGGVYGHAHNRSFIHKQGHRPQTGGMIAGLVLNAILAKKRKQSVSKAMGNYFKKAVGTRIAVAKNVANKKVPTPGNTGLSGGNFLMSGLFGIG